MRIVELAKGLNIAIVDLTCSEVYLSPVDQRVVSEVVGGRGLAYYLMLSYMPSHCDPLDPESCIVLSSSPLGTGGYVVCFKSPLTATYSCVWARGPQGLKSLGLLGVVVEGQACEPSYLVVSSNSVSIVRADEVYGLNALEAYRRLRESYGPSSSIMTVGRACEEVALITCALIDGAVAGRGGLGAVLASKNLKAVILRGLRPTRPSSLEGTRSTLLGYARLGMLPRRNYSETWPASSGVKLAECLLEHNLEANEHVLRVEDMLALSANLVVTDPDAFLRLALRAMDLGLDPASLGNVLGWLIEAYEAGIVGRDEIGVRPSWGDVEALMKLVDLTGSREGIGSILSLGVMRACRLLGRGSESLAVHVNGLEIAGPHPLGDLCLTLHYVTATPCDPLPPSSLVGLSEPSLAGRALAEWRLLVNVTSSLLVPGTSLSLVVDELKRLGVEARVGELRGLGTTVEVLLKRLSERDGAEPRWVQVPRRLLGSDDLQPRLVKALRCYHEHLYEE